MQLCAYVCTLVLSWSIHVYEITAQIDNSYMGCYKDDKSNRAMSIQTYNPRDNSIDKCRDFCRQNDYTFAGLENGSDCHCGEEFHRHGESSACNVSCSGDSGSICGGQMSLSIYSVCPPGRYGIECTLPCPPGCRSRSDHKMCQITTGQCCQGDTESKSGEINCNYFRKTECDELDLDPRPDVDDMSDRAGFWFNLFSTMTFKKNAKVSRVRYFSHAKNGTVFVSFWRHNETESKTWMMVGKVVLKPTAEGVQEKKLKPSESVYVQSGDAIALHYPHGSGIIPYENRAPKISDLEGYPFHDTYSIAQRGPEWKPGDIISFTGAIRVKRLAAIKVFYDCIEECPDGFYGVNCNQTCGNCFEESCHYVDGSCPFGCKPGYKGIKCDIACGANTFGANCLPCSKNCLQSLCDQNTGQCLRGCESGYTGPKCDKSGNRHTAIIVLSIMIPVAILIAVAIILVYICFWKPLKQRRMMQLPKVATNNTEVTMMREENGANNTAFEDPLLLNEQKPGYTSVGI